MVTTPGSGLMMIEGPTNEKNINWLLHARDIEQPHWTFPLLVTRFSRKPVVLQKHTKLSAVGIGSRIVVVTARLHDEKEARDMVETDKTGQKERKRND